ncbi:hypothetical protein GCM10010449_12710 [Streptomyces rectiviolaceus]|uniref:Uncharacterized protein n=1 Tax=Streptomyces rectiviolaceus TaxID=332591 RepID=A0ABP6M926_9ACTN
MNDFYRTLPAGARTSAPDVAREYGRALYRRYDSFLRGKSVSTRPYYVGLSSRMPDFTHLTKRVALVADTMLLSEHGSGPVHALGEDVDMPLLSADPNGASDSALLRWRYGIVTEDLAGLGRWLLDAEPLLRSGLVWYGPAYTQGSSGMQMGTVRESLLESGPLPSFQDRSIDFVVEHGRAVDVSRTKPLASRVVRPVLEIDLPFIDGLSLHDFAQATSEEFDSYTHYRDFMRARLLELDDALEAVDSQVALERIALSIRDEMHAAVAEMSSATRTRAFTRSGAVLGTTSAVLAAVRPDALQGALSFSATLAAGATGLWPTIQAFADNKPRHAQGKWHYVWVLQKRTARRRRA